MEVITWFLYKRNVNIVFYNWKFRNINNNAFLFHSDTNVLNGVSSEVTTTQSGDYCTHFGINSSQNALNDLYSPQQTTNDTDLCRRCSVTTGTTPSWWEVDLGKMYLIAGIRVYGRIGKAPYKWCIPSFKPIN